MKEFKTIHSFFVAGVRFHQANEVIHELKQGEKLKLVPEPENKFDPNAVKIMKDETMLGYVPKKYSSETSAMLEIGKPIFCILTEINPKAEPWERLKVEIVEELEEV